MVKPLKTDSKDGGKEHKIEEKIVMHMHQQQPPNKRTTHIDHDRTT